jgi:hypothetical protein
VNFSIGKLTEKRVETNDSVVEQKSEEALKPPIPETVALREI